MAVNTDLATPDTVDDFEAMCHQLYRLMWSDSSSMRVGRSGQGQFGVDILAFDGKQAVGIQCKHYDKTPFTFKTVFDDVEKADKTNLIVGHLLFATTAPSNAEVVRKVYELSNSRRAQSKFTVSVDFWPDICGHIRMHPGVGRSFIPGYPGGAILEIGETTTQTLAVVQKFESLLKLAIPPAAKGTEADVRVVKVLDIVRDKIREGKTTDAKELLDSLGDPAEFRDDFSRFRWFTNQAAVDLGNGERKLAAEGCLHAFALAPEQEVANFNKVRAYLLLDDLASAALAFDEAISLFPQSATLWSLKININEKQGIANPLEGVPDSVSGSRDILLMRAELHHNQERHQDALELLKQCLELEPDLTDVKRAYLSEALSWAAKDSVQAYYRHLTSAQKLALSDAITNFEPLEKTLTGFQSDSISFEVTSNVSAALMLLGNKERARTIVALSLDRHPLSDGLLRIRLHQLAEQTDFAAMRALTDSRLGELHSVILAQLAEVSANAGDLAWYEKVMAVVDIKMKEDPRLQELRALRFQAMAVTGMLDDALRLAKDYAEQYPDQILAQVVVTEILERQGEKDLARDAALKSLSYVNSDTLPANVLQVAELLYQFQHFEQAAPLYERLVTTPGADSLTWRLMVCLLKGDKRAKVRNVLDKIPFSVREQPEIRQIECDMARRAGDWVRMKNILQIDLATAPESSDVALGYVGSLYQLSDDLSLDAFLSKDTVFNPAILENEFEYAKHQASRGYEELAMRRMYRLYRDNSADTKTASHYLAISLMCKNPHRLLRAQVAGPGTAVELARGLERWWVAIDLKNPESRTGGWPELVAYESEMSRVLTGHVIGDSLSVPRALIRQECEIVSVVSLVAFAGKKAHAQIAASPVPQGPVFTLTVPAITDAINVSALDQQRTLQAEQYAKNWKAYRDIGLPFCVLADILNTDPITLLVDWESYDVPLAVHSGSVAERDLDSKTLKGLSHRYVLDLLTLVELVRSNVLRKMADYLGRPLVPSSVREHLLQLMHAEEIPHTAYTPKSATRIGRPSLRQNGSHRTLLDAVLQGLDSCCDLVPTYGPDDVAVSLAELAGVLDRSTMDALLLSLERQAIFISEDLNLRVSARENGLSTIGTQVVLKKMIDNQRLTPNKYLDILSRKLHENHWFINLSADELTQWALQTKTGINPTARIALKKLGNPLFEFKSVVHVCCQFIIQASQSLSPKVVAEYTSFVHRVLSSGKQPDVAAALTTAIGQLLEHIYGVGGKNLPRETRRKFGDFFQ